MVVRLPEYTDNFPRINLNMYRTRVMGILGQDGALRGARRPDGMQPRRARVLRTFAAAICVLAISAASPPHPFRLSVADAVVDGSTLDVSIRFFWDDLQFAVMEHTSDMEFRLAEDEEVDAVVAQYVNDMFSLQAEGTVLQGTLVERGIQEARNPDEVMWWYRFEYPLVPATDRIHVTNRLLFNMFEDQRNLVNMKTRRGRERTYYFTWDEDNVTIPVG